MQTDAPGIEKLVGPAEVEGEVAGALQKEAALLRKEQRKPSKIDFLVVGLRLSKIGVYRNVEREAPKPLSRCGRLIR